MLAFADYDAHASRTAGDAPYALRYTSTVIAPLSADDGAPASNQPAPKKPRPAISRSARLAKTYVPSPVARASAPVIGVTGPAVGQAGYIHYFVITPSGGEAETQIGIELPDQRIAWSFPGLGVAVSPFIEHGSVQAGDTIYAVEYLYGLRPFPDDDSMRALQAEMLARIVPLVDGATPYCNTAEAPDHFCVSCLGFALRVLFPGASPAYPALPRDFRRVAPGGYYTTDDLLLYLVGLHGLRGKAARLHRVDKLALPDNLRDEVVRLVNAADANEHVAAAEPAKTKSRAGAKSGKQRTSQRRKPS